MANGKYLTYPERCRIDAWLRAGKKAPWIARELKCCKQTVYNEIRRGACHCVREIHGYQRDVIEYSADKAQQVHDRNQTAKGRPIKLGKRYDYAAYLEDKIRGVQPDGRIDRRRRYSPAAALAEARAEGFDITICTTTLYQYISKGVFLHLTNKDLWEKSKKKKRGRDEDQRIAHPLFPSIADRPEAIDQRLEPGHKEMDLIVSGKKGKAAILTMIDRKTRYPYAIKLPDKTAASVQAALDDLERRLGKKRFQDEFRTITTDNGSEFLRYQELKRSIHGGDRFEVYYCHPYSAWEKGQDENLNRMFRRFFPKGTNFDKVPAREIQRAADWIAHYPRRSLGWKSPADVTQ